MFADSLTASSYGLPFTSDYGRHGSDPRNDGFSDGGFLAGPTQDTGLSDAGYGGTFESRHNRRGAGYEGQKYHPLKISIVLRSLEENPQEQRVKFFDEDVSMFKLVGLVTNLHVEEQSEKWSFDLDDGTGSQNFF